MKQIVVLVDKLGTGTESLQHLIKSLRQLKFDCQIKRLRKEELLQEGLKGTDLLIVPGGRDFLYHQSFKPHAAEVISRYVEGGGSYLGICAGAYYACLRVHFGIGHGNEVWGNRQMELFSGIAQGPALGNVPYDFVSRRYCEVVKLRLNEDFSSSCTAWGYYNSGANFIPHAYLEHAKKPTWPYRALATYDDPRISSDSLAIVESWPGSGYALLCGIHPEMIATEFKVSEDPYDFVLKAQLIEHASSMHRLFAQLVERALDPPKAV